ncbi:MAG TPA: hypothetical protein VGD69_20940 [Herpetosiphonaceae bacterium]
MKRRLLSWILCGVLALGALTACGDTSGTGGTGGTTGGETGASPSASP